MINLYICLILKRSSKNPRIPVGIRNNKEAKIFLNKLRSFKNLSIEAALSLNCCPKPLVHSMVKN